MVTHLTCCWQPNIVVVNSGVSFLDTMIVRLVIRTWYFNVKRPLFEIQYFTLYCVILQSRIKYGYIFLFPVIPEHQAMPNVMDFQLYRKGIRLILITR